MKIIRIKFAHFIFEARQVTTHKIQATEMKDANVVRISLVDKAASGIPFRIVKQEKPMSALGKHFDLASVMSVKKKEKVAPTIIAVATMKSDKTEEVKKMVSDAGFKVDKSEEHKDGSVTLEQVEGATPDADTAIIRLSDDCAIVTKSFRPYMMEVAGEDSFADVCKAQGFYPSVSTVVDVMRSGIIELASKADDPKEAAATAGRMIEEAGSYITSMIAQLPSKAFKLEKAINEHDLDPENPDADSVKKEETKEVQKAEDKKEEKPEDVKKEETKPEDKKDEAKTDDAAAVGGGAGDVQKSEDKTKAPAALTLEEVQKMLKENNGTVIQAVGESVSKSLEAVTSSMSASFSKVAEQVTELGNRVTETEAVAKSAKQLAANTVAHEDADDVNNQSVQKSEGRRVGGEIDTAYAPRRRAR